MEKIIYNGNLTTFFNPNSIYNSLLNLFVEVDVLHSDCFNPVNYLLCKEGVVLTKKVLEDYDAFSANLLKERILIMLNGSEDRIGKVEKIILEEAGKRV